MQLFSISESLYGLYGEIQPQGILINIVNINRMGYLYFDSTFNAKIRGGSQLFMLGVISPNIHYLASLENPRNFERYCRENQNIARLSV